MQEIAALASRQHGVVSYWQLRDLGLTAPEITRLQRCARLHRVLPAVYAVGHRALSEDGVRLAASLSVRGGSPVARYSAGHHLGLTTRKPRHGLVEVAVPDVSAARRSHVRVVRLASLDPDDLVVRRGVLCTSVARTLVDLAAVLSEHDLATAVRQAEFQRELDRLHVGRVLGSISRPRGCRALRALLDIPADRVPQTMLERRFLEVIAGAGIPEPVLQHPFVIGDPAEQIRVDGYWPQARVAVEVDGPHHALPAFVQRDRWRDRELEALGITVVRVPQEWLDSAPHEAIRAVRAALAVTHTVE